MTRESKEDINLQKIKIEPFSTFLKAIGETHQKNNLPFNIHFTEAETHKYKKNKMHYKDIEKKLTINSF